MFEALFPPGFLMTVYLVSAVLYLLHVYLARQLWPIEDEAKTHPHFLVRTTLMWKLSDKGYFPLTNGTMVIHTLLGLAPAVNTLMLWFSLCLHVVFFVWETVERIVGKGWFSHTAYPSRVAPRIDPEF